jgi:prepilin-type N-terminal cleavage/methylation domain-containing protein
MTRERNDRGETLIEILIALVIIGLIVSAFFATMSTSASASKAHRDLVTADAVLRDYAESTKQAFSQQCLLSAAGTPVANPGAYAAPLPAGFSAPTETAGPPPTALPLTCPPATAVEEVDITVTLPGGNVKRVLSIEVRKP